MSADVPPVGSIGPWGAGGGGVKLKKLGVVSFVHRTATISIFLSDAKCGQVCRALRTFCCRTAKIGQGVSTGWAKNFEKKFEFFTISRL